MKSRAITNEILYNVIQKHYSLNHSFSCFIPKKTEPREKSFIKECCFGVLRWFHQLYSIELYLLNSPLRKKDADVGILILLGLFQIIHSNVPDHAAVSETVSVCKILKKPWATKLVNKCLRRFIEEKDSILSSLKESSDDRFSFSHPLWLIKKTQDAWPNHWQTILQENNKKPPLWLRINLQKISQKNFLELLQQHDIAAVPSKISSCSVRIEKPIPIQDIPQFDEGYASVQDISGQFAALLLDLKKGQSVLDACAAPGSKTGHILELQLALSKLVIIDKDASRFPLIQENLIRLNLSDPCIQLILADVTQTKQWWDGSSFDRILLDAPCSSTGVIRRHPDIKLLRVEKDINSIARLQTQMLTCLWGLLKKGGKLLYSTCSVLPQENEQIIAAFLSHNDDVQIEKIALPIGQNQQYGLQLFPEENEGDGFYYALLSKKC